MERIKTLETRDMCESAKNGGCASSQTSASPGYKTSHGVANQKCENAGEIGKAPLPRAAFCVRRT